MSQVNSSNLSTPYSTQQTPMSDHVFHSNSTFTLSPSCNTNNLTPCQNESEKLKKNTPRNSIYKSCLRGPNSSPPSPDDSPSEFVPNNKGKLIESLFCSGTNTSGMRRHTLHLELDSNSDILSSHINDQLTSDMKELIIHKNVSRKPPLPPRNKPINNNYKPPPPPSNSKPRHLISSSFQRDYVSSHNSNNLNLQRNTIENIIGPNFTFTFSKPLEPPPIQKSNTHTDENLYQWALCNKRSKAKN